MSDKPIKDYDKFVVRLPEGMRDAIADRAKKNGRSMNSEIVQIIEDALVGSQGPGLPAYDQWLASKKNNIIDVGESHTSEINVKMTSEDIEKMVEKVATKVMASFFSTPEKQKR